MAPFRHGRGDQVEGPSVGFAQPVAEIFRHAHDVRAIRRELSGEVVAERATHDQCARAGPESAGLCHPLHLRL